MPQALLLTIGIMSLDRLIAHSVFNWPQVKNGFGPALFSTHLVIRRLMYQPPQTKQFRSDPPEKAHLAI